MTGGIVELLFVIVVVLFAGFYVQGRMKNDGASGVANSPEFEDSEPGFGNVGVRDITGMSSDGKGGIRDVGDIG